MKSGKTIISDLPDKVEQNQFAWLTQQQAAMEEIEESSETAAPQSQRCEAAPITS